MTAEANPPPAHSSRPLERRRADMATLVGGTWGGLIVGGGGVGGGGGGGSRLLTLAPHLVRLEPLLFPIYGMPYLSKAFYDIGLTLYDVLGARRDGGWHRRLSRVQTLDLAPTLRRQGLHGGL